MSLFWSRKLRYRGSNLTKAMEVHAHRSNKLKDTTAIQRKMKSPLFKKKENEFIAPLLIN